MSRTGASQFAKDLGLEGRIVGVLAMRGSDRLFVRHDRLLIKIMTLA